MKHIHFAMLHDRRSHVERLTRRAFAVLAGLAATGRPLSAQETDEPAGAECCVGEPGIDDTCLEIGFDTKYSEEPCDFMHGAWTCTTTEGRYCEGYITGCWCSEICPGVRCCDCTCKYRYGPGTYLACYEASYSQPCS